jgi:hypothetical protein
VEVLDDEDEDKELCEEALAEFFYLWDIHEKFLKAYEYVRLYPVEDALNPALIETVCKKLDIDFLEALVNLAYIHSGFLKTLYKDVKTNQPETETEDG